MTKSATVELLGIELWALRTRDVAHHEIAGEIVECGVWSRGSMQAAAPAPVGQGDITRGLNAFHTFEGMTEPTEPDIRHDGMSAADMLGTHDMTSRVWAVASLGARRRPCAARD